jgi:hypothetical protein
MGLDMSLIRRTYVHNYDWTEPENKYEIIVMHGGKKVSKDIINLDKISCIEEEIGYWRKANAVHKWFVDNVQDGEDNCESYDVSHIQLRGLYNIVCKILDNSEWVTGEIVDYIEYSSGTETRHTVPGKVIKDPTIANNLLPTQSGFFFGTTEYDEYYYNDLVDTKDILEAALLTPNAEFTYKSSW